MHPFGPWYLLVLVPLVVRNAWLLTPFDNSQPLELVDVPQSTDHYMEPAQHGVQDVLNISTEVHVFHRTRLDLGRARLSLDGEETKDGHAFLSGGPSGQSRKRPYLYPVHPSGSDEPGHLD